MAARGRGVALALALALLPAGCSLSLDGPDPQRPRNRAPACDTGKGLIGLDGVIGAGFGVAGLASLDNNENEAAAITLVISGLYLIAALHGNNTVNACRTAMAEYSERPTLEEPRLAVKPAVAPRPVVRPAPVPPSPEPQPQPPYPDVQAPSPPPPAQQPAPPAPKSDDRWRDFWKELP